MAVSGSFGRRQWVEGFNVLKSFGSSASCICSTYRFRTDEIL